MDEKGWLQKLRERASALDLALSWVERGAAWWQKLPASLRRTISAAVWLALSAATAWLTGWLVVMTGFVQEYWALAVLVTLAGVGSGALLRTPLGAVSAGFARPCPLPDLPTPA